MVDAADWALFEALKEEPGFKPPLKVRFALVSNACARFRAITSAIAAASSLNARSSSSPDVPSLKRSCDDGRWAVSGSRTAVFVKELFLR